MPTPDCWERLGSLDAKVEHLELENVELRKKIQKLEGDRIRLTTIGGVVGFLLTGLGVFFSDVIRGAFFKLFH